MTIRFGRNTSACDFAVTFAHLGAGIDFFGGLAPTTTSLTITNSVITQNTAVNACAPGGAAGVSADDGSLTITNSTISNSETTNQTGGGVSFTGNARTMVMTDTIVSNNKAKGGANGEGGGIFARQTANGTVAIHNSEIENNTSESRAGGIKLESTPGPLTATIDQGTVITGNTSLGTGPGISEGGGLDISILGASTATLKDVTITNNHANGEAGNLVNDPGTGGGIYHSLGNLNVSLSRITGNTAPTGSGLTRAAGTVTAENNWWGCDNFPGAAGCDTVSGTADVDPRLDLVVTADPSMIPGGGMSTVKADVSKNSANTAVNPVVLNDLPITFSATNGTMDPTPVPLASLMATSTYTNTSCPGPATVSAKLDNGTATAGITIDCNSDLGVTKSDASDPVVAGDNITYTINFSNGGPANASAVAVTDAVPANTTFVSAAVTTGTGWTISQPAPGGTGNVVFSKASVANPETAVFQIVVKVDAGSPGGTTISNTATVASTNPDPNSGNNTGTATTTVSIPPTTTTTTLPPTTTTTTTLPPPTTTTTLPPTTTTTLRPTTTTTLRPPPTTTTLPPPPPVTCNGLPATIVGNHNNNTIFGTPGNDVIHGRGGNDVIHGLGGNDRICGGSGADQLFGDQGKDQLFGEGGNDVLKGGTSNDRLFGQQGNDAMDGGLGNDDNCNGGIGTDTATSCEQPRGVP